ncbi:MAG TPA: hypothetical protein VGS61_05225 [Acidimicrobiales bacterium]|nr:hypothetical protein [Acidimicrobiales bacterium]
MTALATTSPTALNDHRGSWVPNGAMIGTRIMELRKRKGLMIALAAVSIGLPTIFLTVRLIAHAVAPKSYGPAGGYTIFTSLVVGVLYTFGFIVAATVGASAGSTDLADGMFRHLVVTGRSRLAIYFARIPAALAIVVTMVAAGFAIVCLVCSLAAPTSLNYDGMRVPQGLSLSAYESWAATHYSQAVCNLPTNAPVPCGPHGLVIGRNGKITVVTFGKGQSGPQTITLTLAQVKNDARQAAFHTYADYSKQFLKPPVSVMIQSGLWIELEAAMGVIVGLGLSSLMGQRTVPIVLLIVLEVILTPLFAFHAIPHLINAERGIIGVAMAHIEPHALPTVFGQGSGPRGNGVPLIPETTTWSWVVIASWIVGWTGLGAWRMARRDA